MVFIKKFFQRLHENKNCIIDFYENSHKNGHFEANSNLFIKNSTFSEDQISKCKKRYTENTIRKNHLEKLTSGKLSWKNILKHTLTSHPFPMIGMVSGLLVIYLVFGGIVFSCLEQEHHVNKCKLADTELNVKFKNILKHMGDTDKSELREMFHIFELLKESGATVEVLEKEIHMNKTARSNSTTDLKVGNSTTIVRKLNFSDPGIYLEHSSSNFDTKNECLRKTKFVVNCPLKWHFFDSVLFSLVTISTIGYGHQVPKTHNGKIFCLIYAAGGIPLIGFFVYYWSKGVNIIEKIIKQRKRYLKHGEKCDFDKRCRLGEKVEGDDDPEDSTEVLSVHAS